MSSYLVDYPFANRLFPGSLDVLKRFQVWGPTVILSDGDVVFQPRKVERSGIREAVERPRAHLRPQGAGAGRRRTALPRRALRARGRQAEILTAVKRAWGDRVTTVFPRQGKFAHDPKAQATCPPPDLTVNRIDELLDVELAVLFSRRPS